MKNDGTLIVWVDTEDGARVERFVTAKMRSPRRGSCFGPEPPIDPAKHTRKCPTCAKLLGEKLKPANTANTSSPKRKFGGRESLDMPCEYFGKNYRRT